MAVRYCAQWCLLIRTFHSPKVDLHRFEVSFVNSVALEFKVCSQGGWLQNFVLCLIAKLCIVSEVAQLCIESDIAKLCIVSNVAWCRALQTLHCV